MKYIPVRCSCRSLMSDCLDHWMNTEIMPSIACSQEASRTHRHEEHREDLPVAAVLLTLQLTQLREPARAEAVLDERVGQSAGQSDRDPTVAILRANIRLAQGDYGQAFELAVAGLAGADRVPLRFLIPIGNIVVTSASLRLGDARSAARYARKLTEDSLFGRLRFLGADAAWTVAQVYEMERGPEAVAGLMNELAGNASHSRELLVNQPAAAPSLVRFALHAGDRATAERVTRAAHLVAVKNSEFRTFRTSAIHAAGLLDGEPEQLVQAAAEHTDPFARACAAEDAGVLLAARDGGRARGVGLLERALNGFGSTGSSYDVARVRTTLRDLGRDGRTGPPAPVAPTRHGLTDTETRVADLVSRGLTNAQVGNQLFLSHHTVAYHLKKMFGKLGVSSRGELTSLWYRREAAGTGGQSAADHQIRGLAERYGPC